MKKISKLLFSLVALLSIAVACEPKVDNYVVGDPDVDGCYGVFFPAQSAAGSHAIDPADPTSTTFTVSRKNSSGAITVPVEVVDKSGIFTVGTLSFADGQAETTLDVSFSSADVGVKYALELYINDPQYASKYNDTDPWLKYDVTREKWNDLGKGTWYENGYFTFDAPEKVTILQNDNNKNLFRAVLTSEVDGEPYYVYSEGQDNYFEFQVLKPGQTIRNTKITQSDLVFFQTYETGYVNTSYGLTIWFMHPSSFTSLNSESNFLHNKVLQYQDNGLPAGVQIAPYYYMNGLSGWNHTQDDNIITIIFPDAVLVDYSIEAKPGLTTDGVTPIAFNLGTDVASVKYAVFDQELNVVQLERAVSQIAEGEIEAEELDMNTKIAGIQCDQTGEYFLVAAAFAADSTLQGSTTTSFTYVDSEDPRPVDVTIGLETPSARWEKDDYDSNNALEYFVYGSDLKDVKIAFYKSEYDPQLPIIDGEESVSGDVLAIINEDIYSGIYEAEAGTEYTMIVYATNGYESVYKSATLATTGEGIVWKSLGNAAYTDDLVSSLFGADNVTYDVEIQELDGEEGIYRLVNPYGEIYPYNAPGDYDDLRNYFFVIDASKPDSVIFDQQSLGLDWSYGTMEVISKAQYYLNKKKPELAAPYYGKLKDGVITFGPKSIILFDDESSYEVNSNGGFKIVLPGAEPAADPAVEAVVAAGSEIVTGDKATRSETSYVRIAPATQTIIGERLPRESKEASFTVVPFNPQNFKAIDNKDSKFSIMSID